MQREEPKFVTWENCDVKVNERVHTIEKLEVHVYPNGTRAISLDEYNKILEHIFFKDKRNSKQKQVKP